MTRPTRLEVAAGTVVLTHFDLFHRGALFEPGERRRLWGCGMWNVECGRNANVECGWQPVGGRCEAIVFRTGAGPFT